MHKEITHVALDSGTGETKVLKFRWVDGGSIEVMEMTKLTSLKGLFDASRESSNAAQEVAEQIRSIVQ